jgi:hypothetical protein
MNEQQGRDQKADPFVDRETGERYRCGRNDRDEKANVEDRGCTGSRCTL